MIDFIATRPDVQVDDREYVRLLGFPAGHSLEDRALELARWARGWYAEHGHPWVVARAAHTLRVNGESIEVDGVAFASTRVRRAMQDSGAHMAAVVAVSAGPEIEQAAQEAWADERPDEYFFLETYGSAVVEHLVTMAGARLCAWADREQFAVLPHFSPGYPGWDVADQGRLLSLVARELPATLEALESGMLRPKKSQLSLFGITRHADRVAGTRNLVPCEFCSYAPCQFRRAPYRRAGSCGAEGSRP